MNQMDSTLYDAAVKGNITVILSSLITDQPIDQIRTPNSDTILHLASESGQTKAVKEILSQHPSLLNEVNSNGDSALHLAAKGGYTDIVRLMIIACAKNLNVVDQDVKISRVVQSWVDISRLKNKEEDTAVHEATRYNHVEVVRLLLDQDPGFNPPTNKSGESPLYLAARRGFPDLIDIIIKACGSPCYDGPNGRTALHGAIVCNSKDCTSKLLRWDKSLVHSEDKYSQTPLHYVARLGFENLVLELLSADASTAYVANNDEENTALLVAASAGHVSIVKKLISHSPFCCEAVNAEGKNVLHIAIEHEQKDVIQYLLKECPTFISSLIIQKDIDGNKPLHLLDTTSNCFIPNLIQHPMADKEALNDNDLTSLDFVTHFDNIKSSTSTAKNEVGEEVNHAGAISHPPNTTTPAPLAVDRNDCEYDKTRNMIANHIIVAALIATIAFTAGLAMPGGFIQSGSPNQGTAVLSRNSVAFQAFVISDDIALLFSTSAIFICLLSTLYDDDVHDDMMWNYAMGAALLNSLALVAIIVAFITGTYAVLHYSYALAIATSVVASLVFLFHLTILLLFSKLCLL